MTEVNRITLNWAVFHTGVYGTLHRPFPAKPTGSAFPYFNFPQTTQCSSERHPKLWWGPVFVWHREQDRSLASLVQLLRGTQTSPRETGWSQSSHGKGGQALEWAGRWGVPTPGWPRNDWTWYLLKMGLIPGWTRCSGRSFPSWMILGRCCQGWRGLERGSGQLSVALHCLPWDILCFQGSLQNKTGRMVL